MSLYPEIVQYRRIVVCVGNNDFNSTNGETLLIYYTDLVEHLPYEHQILLLELLPRMDHAEYYDDQNGNRCFKHTRLEAFKLRMKNKLGSKFYGKKIIHPCHFSPHDKCHLHELGQRKLIVTMSKIANNLLFNFHNMKL